MSYPQKYDKWRVSLGDSPWTGEDARRSKICLG